MPALFDALYFDKLSQLHQDQGVKEILLAAQNDLYVMPADTNLIDVDTPSAYEELYNNFGKE